MPNCRCFLRRRSSSCCKTRMSLWASIKTAVARQVFILTVKLNILSFNLSTVFLIGLHVWKLSYFVIMKAGNLWRSGAKTQSATVLSMQFMQRSPPRSSLLKPPSLSSSTRFLSRYQRNSSCSCFISSKYTRVGKQAQKGWHSS